MSATDPTDTPEPWEVLAVELRRAGLAHDLSIEDAHDCLAALAAAGYEVVPAGTAAERDAVYRHNMTLTDRVQAAEDERDRLTAAIKDGTDDGLNGPLLRHNVDLHPELPEPVKVTMLSCADDFDELAAALAGSDSPDTPEPGIQVDTEQHPVGLQVRTAVSSVCPTCGSDNPIWDNLGPGDEPCPDSWHRSDRGAT